VEAPKIWRIEVLEHDEVDGANPTKVCGEGNSPEITSMKELFATMLIGFREVIEVAFAGGITCKIGKWLYCFILQSVLFFFFLFT